MALGDDRADHAAHGVRDEHDRRLAAEEDGRDLLLVVLERDRRGACGVGAAAGQDDPYAAWTRGTLRADDVRRLLHAMAEIVAKVLRLADPIITVARNGEHTDSAREGALALTELVIQDRHELTALAT